MAEPIKDTTGLPNILTQLLGQQGSQTSNTAVQQLLATLSGQQSSGTTSGTTTNTAELAPLLQTFGQASQGMTPEMLSQLITSVFTEGAQQVPALTAQFANSTGSRVRGNSGLNLALGDLNKNLSSQVVQSLLQYNQNAQNTAANTAAQIAANTRQTQQTGQTAQTQQTQQTQQNGTNTTQQQATKQGVNPSTLSMLGLGGSALNFLDKKGVFNGLFGNGASSAGGGAGTISGGGSLLSNGGASAPTLTNGGGASSGMYATPSANAGFLSAPVAANPYGAASAISSGAAGGAAASSGDAGASNLGGGFSLPAGGITSGGGFTSPSGGIGGLANLGFGSLPTGFNAFGSLDSGSLGSNLDFGSNPYGYAGSAGGITGAVGGGSSDILGGALNAASSGLSSATDWLGGALGSIGDFVGSFFADGGQVSQQDGARELRTMMSQRNNNLATAPAYGFEGMNIGQIMDATARDRGIQGGIQSALNPSIVTQLLMLLGASPATQGLGFADGGQVETGGTTRNRNQNFMGARPQQQRSEAMNYAGYAPAAGVGASVPAGGSPSMSAGAGVQALGAPVAAAATGNSAMNVGDQNAQAWQLFYDSLAREAVMNQRGGGSGGVGEGAAPGQNEADNGQAGIGPSGIAAAPTGTGQAAGLAAGLAGMPAPGLSSILAFMAFMANAVNAANQGGIGVSDDGPEGSVTVGGLTGADGNDAGGVGASGGPGSGSDGGPGDSGVGGDSAGDGTSGSAGTSAGGDGWKDGGLVKGPGTGTSDSVKVKSREAGGKSINYSDGEYVIPKDVVDALGVAHFDAILDAFHTPATLQQ